MACGWWVSKSRSRVAVRVQAVLRERLSKVWTSASSLFEPRCTGPAWRAEAAVAPATRVAAAQTREAVRRFIGAPRSVVPRTLCGTAPTPAATSANSQRRPARRSAASCRKALKRLDALREDVLSAPSADEREAIAAVSALFGRDERGRESVWFPPFSMARTSQSYSVSGSRKPGGTRSRRAVGGIMTSRVIVGKRTEAGFRVFDDHLVADDRAAVRRRHGVQRSTVWAGS